MPFVRAVAIVEVLAVVTVLVVARALRALSVPGSVGFWLVMLCVMLASFIAFFRWLPGVAVTRTDLLKRASFSVLLAILTYLVAINGAFAVATYAGLIFGTNPS